MSEVLTLTIVIPVYNEQQRIETCLEAIARQTVMPEEVIVVDNGSTDATKSIASRFRFVTLVDEPRRGISYSRDKGFDSARCQLIARIDADTIVPADWVQRIKLFYDRSGWQKVALTGGAVFRNMPLPRFSGWLQNQLAFRLNWLALGHHIVWGSNMVIPVDAWGRIRSSVCHQLYIHEDIDLAIHLHKKGVGIVFDPRFLVSAELKRIVTDKDQLWFNLKWWPRTLKRHGKKRWLVALVAAATVYVLAFFARFIDRQR